MLRCWILENEQLGGHGTESGHISRHDACSAYGMRITAPVSILAMTLALAACGGGNSNNRDAADDGPQDGELLPDFFGGAALQCLDKTDEPTEASLLAAAAMTRGASFDIPLSPKGCWRLRGDEHIDQIVRVVDIETKIDFDAGGINIVPKYSVVLDTATQATGMQIAYDGDDDGFAEWRQELVRDSAGLKSRTDSTYSPSSKQIIAQTIITRISSDTVHVVLKRSSGGPLATFAEYDAPLRQERCYTPASGGSGCAHKATTCSSERIAALKKAAADAVAKAKTCLPDNVASPGAVAAMRFLGMARVDFRCVTGKCFVAALDDMEPGGVYPILVDEQMFQQRPNGSFYNPAEVLFHEMSHIVLPFHDPSLINAAGPVGLQYQIDQVYACQAFCFAPKPNRCHCARCLGVKTCDPRCNSLPTCDVPNIGRVYGKVATETYSRCPGSNQLCDTVAECKSTCADPATCENHSLSCDPTCM
ncbi:MAG: hypothetical protein KC503_24100 [Myxococcales bacterium]|nr:hypothetical protein [Myxococcales bacterium]